jgi:three-Cys-motif partner protein
LSLFAEELTEVGRGSAKIALQISPSFSHYVFVDAAAPRVQQLEFLKTTYPDRSVEVQHQDANVALMKFARETNWKGTRALVFIDPYGMQVKWATLEVLAQTKAIDIILLFPTGPLNRMLSGDGQIPTEWADRIDKHLGECDWLNAAYKVVDSPDLFDVTARLKKTIDTDGLREFVRNRFISIFPFVCDQTFQLKNSKNSVLYDLFIICANPAPRAGDIAMRLARAAIHPKGRKRSKNG